MIEATVDITTADGAMKTFICHPERDGPYPAVFLLMDACGVREQLRDWERLLALYRRRLHACSRSPCPRGRCGAPACCKGFQTLDRSVLR